MPRPLKLLHVIRSVDPKGGGPIEGVLQLAKAAREFGTVSEILSIDSPEAPFLKNYPLKVYPVGPGSGGYGYTKHLVPWLKEHRKNYDAVIVNGIWCYNSFGTWRALRGTDTPYVVYSHGMLDPWFKRTYPLKHLKKWLYWPWSEYRVLRDAAAVLFTCEEERRLARDSFWLYRAKEQVVNYGTLGVEGEPEAQRRHFLDTFPQLINKDTLLFLGRVHVKKGPDLLVKAFAEVRKALPPEVLERAHLVMAGPDDHAYADEIKELIRSLGIEEHVTWTGMVSGDLKRGAFRTASAFVLPSHQENFGISVAEALSAGVPVLISRSVNIWKEIEADRAGLFCEDTLDSTIHLLRRWYQTSPQERTAMQSAAKRSFETRFHISKAAESLHRVIERVSKLQSCT